MLSFCDLVIIICYPLHILKRVRFLFSEVVWGVMYKVEKDGVILRRQEYDIMTYADLTAAITLPSPNGGQYRVYNLVGHTLRRSSSAFYVYINQPVLTVDRETIEEKLVEYWVNTRTGR